MAMSANTACAAWERNHSDSAEVRQETMSDTSVLINVCSSKNEACKYFLMFYLYID